MATTDKNGREIMPGDTLKIYHFTGARRKRYYMYKYVIGIANGVSDKFYTISHLDLAGAHYTMLNDDKRHDDIEIVQGYSADGVQFDQRVRL